jgi:hypothetical protein
MVRIQVIVASFLLLSFGVITVGDVIENLVLCLSHRKKLPIRLEMKLVKFDEPQGRLFYI